MLISARDTSAIYKLDRASGRIVWRLGGSASDFKLGKGASFHFQHDARFLGGHRVSMFDDEAGPPQFAPSSRGLVLKLHRHPHKATVVHAYHRQADTSAQSEGSLQTLPDGSAFVGWGAEPFFSQFSPRGRLLFDANLPVDDGSYRVYRFPWKANAEDHARLAAVTRTDAVERDRLRELERGHRGRQLAGARRRLARTRWRRSRPSAARASRPRSTSRARRRRSPSARSTPTATPSRPPRR